MTSSMFRLQRPLAWIILALTLAGSLSAEQPVAWADKTDKKSGKKPAQTEHTSAHQKTPTKDLKALPPVLSDDAKNAIQAAGQQLDTDTRTTLNKLSEAIRLEDRAVYNDLRDEEELSMADIGMLWAAAVERSGTIRYAIEKLSRRDATGKPVGNDSFSKRMLQNLVHLGGVAGSMWTQTPAGLIGSSMVDDLMSANPQDSALSRVTDADMVILAKEVEALQTQLIELYYGYRHAQERLKLTQEAETTVGKYYDHATNTSATADALQPLVQSIYDATKQDGQSAQQALNSARNALTLLVGPEAVAALERDKTASKPN